jgi:hypothetical protein
MFSSCSTMRSESLAGLILKSAMPCCGFPLAASLFVNWYYQFIFSGDTVTVSA